MALSIDTILKWPTPHKIGIVAGISVVIMAVYWFNVYQPKMKRITVKESQLADLKRDMNNKEIIANNYEKFKQEMAEKENELQRSLSKLPDQKEIPALLKSVSDMSQKAGLDVLLFRPQGEQPQQFFSKVPLELKFIGSYHKIGLFFYYVGTLSRIISVDSFSLSAAQQKKKDEIQLNATCVATTYRYIESAPPKTPAKPNEKK
jgi:type IV pilus assembly protein PilO